MSDRNHGIGLARLQHLLEGLDRTINFDQSTFGGNVAMGSSSSDIVTVTSRLTASQGGYFAEKVGIGTTTPNAYLDIRNTVDDGTTNRTMLRLHNYRSDDADVNDFGPISIDFVIENLGGGTKTGTARIAAVSSPVGTDHTTVLGEKSSALIFSTMKENTLAEAVRINHEGSLGIGTTEPVTSLDVTGSAGVRLRSTNNAANSIYLHTDAGTSETIKIHSDQGTSVTEGAASVSLLSDAGGVELRSTANLANAVNITADGGTTSTITIFNDTGTSATDGAASIQVTSDVGRVELKSGLGAAKAIYLHTDAGSTESIYLHNVQGTGQGAITLHTPAGGAYILANKASGYALSVDNNGGNQNRYAIKARGGADNGSGTTHYLYAEDGDGTAVGSIKNVGGTFQLADASDRRLKKNIIDTVINALDIIDGIKVRDFDWIKNDVHCVAGFIAQELQEVFPSAADGSEDQVDPETGETIYMTASRDVLVPVLIKAVQELTARVEALEA